jgi:phosphoribosylformylglycinamidine cyclo-ligase
LADELLRPSVIYAPTVLAAVRTGFVHAAAHITGGGLPGNLVRAMPEGSEAVVDRSDVVEPRIFDEIRRIGPVDEDEMERVFNLGIGMVLVVSPAGVDDVLAACSATVPAGGSDPVVVGTVESGERGVRVKDRN